MMSLQRFGKAEIRQLVKKRQILKSPVVTSRLEARLVSPILMQNRYQHPCRPRPRLVLNCLRVEIRRHQV
jgi:hypothetical protein